MTPEVAMKKAVHAMRILSEIWHPDLSFASRRHLANCIGSVKDLADVFNAQKKIGWHYGENDEGFAEQIWSLVESDESIIERKEQS